MDHFRVSVSLSVCLSVRASVSAYLQKSVITLDSLDGPVRNFQGPLNYLQVIFWRVTWASCSGQYTKRGVSAKSPPRVLGQGVVYTFSKTGRQDKKMLGAHGLRKWGQNAQLAGGATKILDFQNFS